MTAAYYIGEEARTGCVIHRHASGQVDLADEPDGEPFVIMAPVSDAPCPGHVVIGAHPVAGVAVAQKAMEESNAVRFEIFSNVTGIRKNNSRHVPPTLADQPGANPDSRKRKR
jgi:hypothetical protein